MRTAIITIAGISSRFNEGIPEEEKVLKAIYSDEAPEDTLLYHLLLKCAQMDRIILVGGYRFDELKRFVADSLKALFPQIVLIENQHYEDLASGYSLYLGIQEAVKAGSDEVLFVEGDLDVDAASFAAVAGSQKSVLTYTHEPIYANKAVVLYQDAKGKYKYAFNSAHGLLTIDEPFYSILNSGQIWKFRDIEALRRANDAFFLEEKCGTNLRIIQRYIDSVASEAMELHCLKRWVNCNTREDYSRIRNYWRTEL